MKQNVIAVVGPMASGKGTLIDILQAKGFAILSLSDAVREKTRERQLPLTRKNLQDVGDALRKKFGGSILVELIASRIRKYPEKKFVIDGVRNPAEVKYIKKNFNAFVIGITASSDKRFVLLQQRKKEGDPKTREAFNQLESRDRGVKQEQYGQQVDACLRMADIVIDNNGTLHDFKENLTYFFSTFLD